MVELFVAPPQPTKYVKKSKDITRPGPQPGFVPNGTSADLEDIISLCQSFGVDEDKLAEGAMIYETQQMEITIVGATKQFCLQQVPVLYAQHAELTAQHRELNAQHAELTAQHAELAAQIDAMRASTSWRLTEPVRWTVSWLREYRSMLTNH